MDAETRKIISQLELKLKREEEKRVKAEALLLQTRKNYETFFNKINDLLFVLDENGNIVHTNSIVVEKLGFSREELSGKPVMVVHPEDRREEAGQIVMEMLQGKEIYCPVPLVTKKGSQIPVETRVAKGTWNGRPALFGVSKDVSKQYESEQLIKQYLGLQELLLNLASTYINIELDKVDEVIQQSLQEMAEFVGADRTYIFDYDFAKSTCSNTYEWCTEGISPEINNLQDVPLEFVDEAWLNNHKNGQPFYVPKVDELPDDGPESLRGILEPQGIKSLMTIPMISNGKATGFVGFDSCKDYHHYSTKEQQLLEVFSQMLVNIADKKNKNEQIKIQQERFINIISNMDLGIAEVDRNNNIVFVNQQFTNLTGYTMPDLQEMGPDNYPFLGDGHMKISDAMRLYERGQIVSFELSGVSKDGHVKHAFVSGAPNYDTSNVFTGAVAVFLDITEQKHIQEELKKAKDYAVEASKLKEVFLANMSHEIRTPLNVIIGMIRELDREVMTPKQSDYIKHAKSSATHLLSILNNILDISKIEAGEFELHYRPFSLNALVSDVESILKTKAKEKELTFHIDVQKKVPNVYMGDENRIRQVLINLLGNAIKFTDKGFVSLRVTGEDFESNRVRLKFEVADSGIGVSDEFKTQIFEKFTQEQNTNDRRFEGTGLGLNITRDLIHIMGGEIQLHSEKGVGTVITFDMTLDVGSEADLAAGDVNFNRENLFGRKILIVEDNELNRFITRLSLQTVGCVIAEAENGQIAVEMIRKNMYDVVLMDIQMPVMDGVAATRYIRNELKCNVPILALTANTLRKDIELYLTVGMNDYILKPYKEIEMFKTIDRNLPNPDELSLCGDQTEPLYSLDGLNEMSRGDKQFVQNMLSIFIQMTEESCRLCEEYQQAGEFDKISKLAHKLKPSIDNLRIKSIVDDIRFLEKFNPQTDCHVEFSQKLDKMIIVMNEVMADLKNLTRNKV